MTLMMMSGPVIGFQFANAQTNGLDCWDLNGNGVFDVATEDKDGDGIPTADDCQGPQGPSGPQGETGPEGPKGDKGDQGDTGPAGTSQAGSWAPNSPTDPDGKEFVKWDIEKINTDTNTFGFKAGEDHIVIKQSGTYLVTASVFSDDLSPEESATWQLQKNGASICFVLFESGGAFDHNSCTVITIFDANDQLQLKDFNSSSNIFGDPSGDRTILSVQKLS